MTQEEKQELIVALCGYLPYKCKGKYEIVRILESETKIERFDDELDSNVLDYDFENENFKPYLRPMSSMTEEEKEELRQEHIKDEKLFAECLTKMANGDSSIRGKVVPHFAADWCNKNHFDYRGLIPMGLALEATEEMYN